MKTFSEHWAFLGLLLLLGTSCDTKQPQVTDDVYKDPTYSVNHINFTENCAECHENTRLPPHVDLVNTPHGFGLDCSGCHSYPAWATLKANVLQHIPTPTACLGCHTVVDEAATHPPQGECAPCHTFPVWKNIKTP